MLSPRQELLAQIYVVIWYLIIMLTMMTMTLYVHVKQFILWRDWIHSKIMKWEKKKNGKIKSTNRNTWSIRVDVTRFGILLVERQKKIVATNLVSIFWWSHFAVYYYIDLCSVRVIRFFFHSLYISLFVGRSARFVLSFVRCNCTCQKISIVIHSEYYRPFQWPPPHNHHRKQASIFFWA